MGVNSNPNAGLNEGSGAGAVSSVNSKTGAVVLAAADVGAIAATAKGVANGVASLGADGKVPAGQLSTGGGGVTLTEVTAEIRKYIGSSGGTPYPSISDSTSHSLGTYASTGTGGNQTALGQSAVATGYGATASGSNAQAKDTYGASFGSFSQALERSVTVGSFGYSSESGTALGFSTNANNNSFAVARQADTGSYSNAGALGYQTTVTGNNQIQIGNSATTTYTYGSVQNRSDARDKSDIQDCDLGLDFINALQPKKWKWDYREDYAQVLFVLPDQPMPAALPENATEEESQAAALAYQQAFANWQAECQTVRDQRTAWMADPVKDGSKTRQRYHFGVIAQEVKTTLDSLNVDWGGYQDHSVNGGQPVESIGYNELIAPLIKSIQELSARVQQLEQQQN